MTFEAYQRLFTRLLTELWHIANQTAFQARLQPPVFAIAPMSGKLGTWEAVTRTITISRQLMLERSRLEIDQVLRHEMAHQYADEILGVTGETPHGSAFRHACRLLDIEHHARFNPIGEAPPILQKIRKLLALAESGNPHEAALAMEKARTLMDKYELELGEQDGEFRYIYLGKPTSRRSAVRQMVGSLLSRFFHVRVVWAPSMMAVDEKAVWVMEINGHPAHLEVAEYVHDYLLREVEFLWRRHRQSHPQVKGAAAKRDFQTGVVLGVTEQLRESEAPPMDQAGREVMLVREHKLEQFFRDRHPRTRRGGRIGYRDSATYREGFSEGEKLQINKGVKSGGVMGRLKSGK